MDTRKYRPTMPGCRGASIFDFVELAHPTPEESLLVPKPRAGGRNNSGRIVIRHIGGGHKQTYCIIDFRHCDKDRVPAKVVHTEYDPNRTARIALLHYRDGGRRCITAPNDPTQDTVAVSGPGSDIKPGNNLGLWQTPIGAIVYAVELRPRDGAKLGRFVGAAIQLVAREGKYTTLRMPSGEMCMIGVRCRATIGTIGNAEQSNTNQGKAGRSR